MCPGQSSALLLKLVITDQLFFRYLRRRLHLSICNILWRILGANHHGGVGMLQHRVTVGAKDARSVHVHTLLATTIQLRST